MSDRGTCREGKLCLVSLYHRTKSEHCGAWSPTPALFSPASSLLLASPRPLILCYRPIIRLSFIVELALLDLWTLYPAPTYTDADILR